MDSLMLIFMFLKLDFLYQNDSIRPEAMVFDLLLEICFSKIFTKCFHIAKKCNMFDLSKNTVPITDPEKKTKPSCLNTAQETDFKFLKQV